MNPVNEGFFREQDVQRISPQNTSKNSKQFPENIFHTKLYNKDEDSLYYKISKSEEITKMKPFDFQDLLKALGSGGFGEFKKDITKDYYNLLPLNLLVLQKTIHLLC